jgi:membrane-associated phospholipid phosphatase
MLQFSALVFGFSSSGPIGSIHRKHRMRGRPKIRESTMTVSRVGRPFLKRISILDALNLSFLGIVFIFYLLAFTRTPYRARLLFFYMLLLLFVLSMSWVRESVRRERFKKLVLFLYPVAFLFSIFETFYMLLPFFNSLRLDALIANIDRALLGVNPTVMFYAFIPCALGITISLVYLRYHYVIDVIVGFVWALASYRFATTVYHAARRKVFPHFGSGRKNNAVRIYNFRPGCRSKAQTIHDTCPKESEYPSGYARFHLFF